MITSFDSIVFLFGTIRDRSPIVSLLGAFRNRFPIIPLLNTLRDRFYIVSLFDAPKNCFLIVSLLGTLMNRFLTINLYLTSPKLRLGTMAKDSPADPLRACLRASQYVSFSCLKKLCHRTHNWPSFVA